MRPTFKPAPSPALRSTIALFAMLLVLPAFAANAAPQSERPRPFWEIFRPAAETPAQPRRKQAAAKRKSQMPLSDAQLQKAVRDTIASNPALLQPVVSELIRNDPEIRKLLTPQPAPVSRPAEIPADQARVEEIVRNYLLRQPEIMEEVMRELEKKQALAEAEKARKGIREHARLLFDSPRQVTLGNAKGDVTMVEFFDYNCGYCKRALGDMLTLMKGDPNLRVVLKEFPVLGQPSMEAAQVAVAVSMQDKSGKKYLDFHQRLLGLRGPADRARALAAAKEAGLDMARLEKDMASAEVKATIDESGQLAAALGISGTPTFIVGNDIVVGAQGVEALKEKINTARCGKATC